MNTLPPTDSIITVDCHYLCPQFAASYLMIEGDRAAFIETNTTHAVPRLLAALEANRMTPAQVAYIVVTHVHLDHCGGAALLARMCPNATILAHEKAAKHIIDPEKLIRGAIAVYGEERFKSLYGDIAGIDEARVRVMADREVLALGGRTLEFIYTAGHAWHHFCVFDSKTRGLFSGDAFGLSYPVLNRGSRPFIFPSTSPTGFDPAEAAKSIEKILAAGPRLVYLTHYGAVTDVKPHAAMLLEYIQRMADIVRRAKARGAPDRDLERFCTGEVERFFQTELESRGLTMTGELRQLLDMDIRLNGQGLAWTARQG